MGKYHYTLGFPERYSHPKGTYKLRWTNHALKALYERKFGTWIEHIDTLKCSEYISIEVEMDGQHVRKVVLQKPYEEKYLFTIVVMPQRGAWVVKTVWLNNIHDRHATLRIEEYDLP